MPEVCSHNISLADLCSACVQESMALQPVWKMVPDLMKDSKYQREGQGPECTVERGASRHTWSDIVRGSTALYVGVSAPAQLALRHAVDPSSARAEIALARVHLEKVRPPRYRGGPQCPVRSILRSSPVQPCTMPRLMRLISSGFTRSFAVQPD